MNERNPRETSNAASEIKVPASPSPTPPEQTRKFFITHVGWVTVNNYGAVEFDTFGGPRVILAADTLYSMTREVRASIAEMRKEKVYAR